MKNNECTIEFTLPAKVKNKGCDRNSCYQLGRSLILQKCTLQITEKEERQLIKNQIIAVTVKNTTPTASYVNIIWRV